MTPASSGLRRDGIRIVTAFLAVPRRNRPPHSAVSRRIPAIAVAPHDGVNANPRGKGVVGMEGTGMNDTDDMDQTGDMDDMKTQDTGDMKTGDTGDMKTD